MTMQIMIEFIIIVAYATHEKKISKSSTSHAKKNDIVAKLEQKKCAYRNEKCAYWNEECAYRNKKCAYW